MTGVQTCALDRKSTRLNSSHTIISYAVFCLKKKDNQRRGAPLDRLGAEVVAVDLGHEAVADDLEHGEAKKQRPPSDVRPCFVFFLNEAAPPEIPPLPPHGPLPI